MARVARSVAGGAVYRSLDAGGSSTLWTVSGEILFQGKSWLLAVGQPARGGNTLSINVYRWSGTTWSEQAAVHRVPDDGSLVGTGQWYGVVPTTGSSEPTFVLRGVYPSWSAKVSSVGRTWHVTS